MRPFVPRSLALMPATSNSRFERSNPTIASINGGRDRSSSVTVTGTSTLPLRAIASLIGGREGETRSLFADAVSAGEEEPLSLVELAERTRVPPALLRSLEGSGLLRPRRGPGDRPYTAADASAVRMLLSALRRRDRNCRLCSRCLRLCRCALSADA